MILIVDDDQIMAECIAKACLGQKYKIVSNAYDAMSAIDDGKIDLIFLDIMLSGPDGFSFLNEIAAYQDTIDIPVVVVSSLDLSGQNLSAYGVVGILNKETMKPGDVTAYATKYLQ